MWFGRVASRRKVYMKALCFNVCIIQCSTGSLNPKVQRKGERLWLSSYQGDHTGHECDADNLKSHKQTHKIPEDFKPWLDQLLYDATLSGCGDDGVYLPDE